VIEDSVALHTARRSLQWKRSPGRAMTRPQTHITLGAIRRSGVGLTVGLPE
jgi:hypothetical protein